jgi:flagellar hook-associated protein 1 FlgK
MSLFQGLEIGKKALIAHQLSLNTTGHNIANVDTPGFTRQRVQTAPSYPMDTIEGPIGTGIDVVKIEHIRDLFLTDRWRSENQNLGRWQAKSQTLEQIEGFLNEPQDSSLGAILNEFWSAWQDLADNPEAPETRRSVVQQAHLVENAFHQIHSQLTQLQQSIDSDIQSRVSEINNLGKQIADLNRQISNVELGGEMANDLRDKRDLLIDELSKFVNVRSRVDGSGQAIVQIGAMGFVDGSSSWELEPSTFAEGSTTKTSIVWKNTSFELDFFNGEMKGLIELRDEIVPNYISKLDTLAATIVEKVNETHRAGYGSDGSTGLNFFDPFLTTAEQITLNIELENDPRKLAASQSGETGDSSNALAIANVLKVDRIMDNNSATIEEYYNSMIGLIGIEVREASDQTENYELLVRQLENSRQSVQGVSLDEEMTNMIKFQHAYEAAARVITYLDSALSTVINGMGVTR